jgi:flagellar basal-body rod protein FlgF
MRRRGDHEISTTPADAGASRHPFLSHLNAPGIGQPLALSHASVMDPLTAAAASGIRTRMESLDMLANNLANASTGGFKVDHEFYSTFIGDDAENSSEMGTGQMPMVQKPWIDFTQGTLQETGHPLDVALTGPGFFAVNGPSGPLYTRNGGFQVSNTGLVTTGDGYPVRLEDGKTLKLGLGDPPDINTHGEVSQNGQLLGKLEITSFADTGKLSKAGSTYFKAAKGAGERPSTAQVHQKSVENSNVVTAEAAIRLVTVMRHFESLQKAITVGTQMNQQSISEIARVNS